MPLPVIANVFRVAIAWDRNAGVAPVNVFHVRAVSASLAGDVLNTVLEVEAAHHDMWECLKSGTTNDSVTVTPLDGSSAGAVGKITGTRGAGGGDTIPAAAFVISIRTGQRGPRGRGRLYIGPCVEDDQSNGVCATSTRDTMQTAWNDFATDLNDALTTPVHFGVASYVHSDFHESVSIVCDSIVGTQRRRQDQLR